MFQDKTLGEIDVPLVLPSVDIGNGCVHVFKSQYHGEFVRDQNVRVSDAVLASCSAPTYFDPHVVNDTYQLVDGGLPSDLIVFNPMGIIITYLQGDRATVTGD